MAIRINPEAANVEDKKKRTMKLVLFLVVVLFLHILSPIGLYSTTIRRFQDTAFEHMKSETRHSVEDRRQAKEMHILGKRENITSFLEPIQLLVKCDEQDEATRFLKPPPSSFCAHLGSKSALGIWTDNIDRIFESSQHRFDRDYKLHDATAQLLKLITPRLPLSIRNVPANHEAIKTILTKAHARYAWIHSDKNAFPMPEPPPLRILVMGGSVTWGQNCWTGVQRLKFGNCAWPARLQDILDKLAGGKIVNVDNMSGGGINTETGTQMLKSGLAPDEVDIVINAYSTNDMHVHTMADAQNANTTIGEKNFEMAQEFVMEVLQPRPCHQTPLLLWLDDYLGNEQREIMATTEATRMIEVLASYYGFGYVSYANAVRDLVYHSTRGSPFAPPWYKDNGSYRREIHPPWPMHWTVSFIMVHYFLHLATFYCAVESWEAPSFETSMVYNATKTPGLPPLKEKDGYQKLGFPKAKSGSALPPILTPELLLSEVSDKWQAEELQMEKMKVTTRCKNDTISSTMSQRCPFAWYTGLPFGPVKAYKNTEAYFAEYLEKPSDWAYFSDSPKGKYGWIPTNSTDHKAPKMILDFSFDRPVDTVKFFILKSYGKKWENSTARMAILDSSQQDQPIATQVMTGYHDKHTSETYTETILLSNPIQSLKVSISLVNGTTFKIMGLSVCSSS